MMVTTRDRTRWLGAGLAAALLVSACSGADEESGDDAAAVAQGSPAGTTGIDGTPIVDADPLPPMEVVASLGYPRDLLDRGRVNLEVSRDDDTEFVVLDKQLVTDFFEPAPVEERRTVLPPDGQVVSMQTLFGEVVDCESPDVVSAVVKLTIVYGGHPTPQSVTLPLTDATTLDGIRTQKCTIRHVSSTNRIELGDPVLNGETIGVDLVITRVSGNDLLAFDSIKGTVLFGATTPFESHAPERILRPEARELIIPLTFVVNRCDSHAVAETTRKFGLDLYVAVNGAESQRIDVAIEPIRQQLEAMLDLCKQRTGQ